MRSYPIWNSVNACNYSSSKSWGSKDTMSLTQFIGSSADNSEKFVEVATTRRLIEEDGKPIMRFQFYVDGVCLKRADFEVKDGRAGKLIDIKRLLNWPVAGAPQS